MISKRAQNISPSITLSISAKTMLMKKQGMDVVSFGAGEPDFDTPDHIKKAAIKAINEGFTKYTPTSGIPELKQAIVDKLRKDNGLVYAQSQILVSNGAKQCLYNILQVLLDPGDEVLIISPYWVSYEEMVKLAQGKCIFVPSKKDFTVDSELLNKYKTNRTKVLIINSPSNPTGAVYGKKELEEIAKFCVKNKIYVISDEIYEKLVYGKKHFSIASLNKEIYALSIVVNGVSKTYAMTGWRIGYCAGAEDIIKAASSLQDHSTSNPNSIAQKAALAALTGSSASITKMKKEYIKRRNYMVKRISRMRNVSAQMPDGAFYVFMDVSKLYNKEVLNSKAFCEKLLSQYYVAAVPGSGFGDDRFIRLSFATSMDTIKKGLDRIEEFIGTF